MKELSGFHVVRTHWNSEKLAPNSHWVIHMIFIYKITEVKFCISLLKYHNMTLAANDATTYTPCLRPQGTFLCDMAHIFSAHNQPFCIWSRHSRHICPWQTPRGPGRTLPPGWWWPLPYVDPRTPVSSSPSASRHCTGPSPVWVAPLALGGLWHSVMEWLFM